MALPGAADCRCKLFDHSTRAAATQLKEQGKERKQKEGGGGSRKYEVDANFREKMGVRSESHILTCAALPATAPSKKKAGGLGKRAQCLPP